MGAFDSIVKNGTDIPALPQRYKPLTGDGKPLWEFKEHGDRIYCERLIVNGNKVLITLFNGWSKGKEGEPIARILKSPKQRLYIKNFDQK
jgi:hypothetical protein